MKASYLSILRNSFSRIVARNNRKQVILTESIISIDRMAMVYRKPK